MDLIIIEGGKKLNGTIDISGSKNASLPMMIASLLTKQTVELNNVPNLSDVETLKHLLRILGSEIVHNNRLIKIKTEIIIHTLAPYDLVRKMRASFWVLAPLIARFGSAEVSLPGGCAIGIRPINMYLKIMEKMNVSYAVENGYVKAKSKEGLRGSKITLNFQSVGCTHFFLMLAVLAKGDSSLENSACEPEVVALGRMLQKMGAKIEGLGTKKINITGVESLSGLSIQVPSDRIEDGTWIDNPERDSTPVMFILFVPSPSIFAPIFCNILPNATTSGSHAEFSNDESPLARTASMRKKCVHPTD